MSLGQNHLLISESLLESQEANGAHPGDIYNGRSPFWGALSTMRTLVLASTILASSLELITAGIATPTSLMAPVLDASGQAASWVWTQSYPTAGWLKTP